MKLKDKISDYTRDLFSTWEASAQEIDENRAIYSLGKPGSEYRRVTMFRDGHSMFLYGDYGHYAFDSMTWLATPEDLPYDNLGYLLEKMNRECKESLLAFDESDCRDDLFAWFKDRLETQFDMKEEDIQKLITVIDESHIEEEVEEWMAKQGMDDEDVASLVAYVYEALGSIDEYAWISFLRETAHILENFDEVSSCDLWNAGKHVNSRFYATLYAMQVCGEKLREREMNVDLETERD